jgi:hypothetical protein
MCWMDSSRLIAWGYGEDEEDLIPAATIYDAQTAKELFWFVGPVSNSQKIKRSVNNKETEISIPGGKFVCDDYLFSIDSQAGMTIWDIETGERLLADQHFSPVGYHQERKCFLSIQGNGVFVVSRLENQKPSHPVNSLT